MEFGRFQIERELGRGAFGRVYQAYDPATGRRVALKVLSADSDAESLSRFQAEASMTADLSHKNIVRVFEFAEEKGCPYLVMELLDGKTLQQIIGDQAPARPLEKLEILRQVAEGLQYAHARGVIHRDVKPGNIMVCPDQTVKIMDFGTAAIAGHNGTRRTQKGDLLGTILYMAPELFDGAEAQRKSDIFSYGVVCYEFLAGVHPFRAEDPPTIMYRISTIDPPAIRSVLTEGPEGLDALLDALLQKDPEVRCDSFDDVLLDLNLIIRQLRASQASDIFVGIPKLIEDADFKPAREALKRVLELDPGHAKAWEVREDLRRREQDRVLRTRLQAAKTEAKALMAAKKMGEARTVLESAAKLGASDAELLKLLDETQAALERARRVSRLLSEARWEQHTGNWEGALEKAAAAADLDPDNQQAADLVQELKRELEKIAERARQQEQARLAAQSIRSAIEKNDLTGAQQEFDSAIALFPDSGDFREVSTELLAALAARDRRLAIENVVTELHSLLKAASHDEALAKAAAAEAELGSDTEISNCKRLAEEEIQARDRACSAVQHIEQLIRDRDWDAALLAITQTDNDLPGRIPRPELEEKIAQGRHREELTNFSETVRTMLESEDFEAAERQLASKRDAWENEEVWRSLEREFRERHIYLTALLMAEKARSSAENARARELLLAVVSFAPDDRAQKILAAIGKDTESVPPMQPELTVSAGELTLPRKRRQLLVSVSRSVWWFIALVVATLIALAFFFFFRATSGTSRPVKVQDVRDHTAQLEWIKIEHTRDVTVLQKYISSYPKSPFAKLAAERMAELDWERVRRDDLASLKDYVSRYPSSIHVPEANNLIASLSHERQTTDDRSQILDSIAAYTSAIRSRRELQLKRVWPGISQVDLNFWRKSFEKTRSIEMQLQPISEPVINGLTARVYCRRRVRKVFPDNQPPYSDNGIIYILCHKYKNGWLITSVSAP